MRKIIKTDKAPAPIGPYNQAVACGPLLYTSGQIPLDMNGVMCLGDVGEQTRVVLNNLKGILEGAGSSLAQVIKVTVFLKNMNDFAAMNAVYTQYFDAPNAPARTTIEVARIPKDSLVEIEAVAFIPSH